MELLLLLLLKGLRRLKRRRANNGLCTIILLVYLHNESTMSSEDKQYGKPDKGTDRQAASQAGWQGDRQIDNGDPRQCSGGKLKMVMKMKSYEYHAPLVEVT